MQDGQSSNFFIDTVSRTPVEYSVTPQNGGDYRVHISPDIKSGHDSQSPHPADKHNSVYWAIGEVIKNPTTHFPSASRNQGHLKLMQSGHVEIYEQHDFFETFDIPAYKDQYPHSKMVVPVFYPDQPAERCVAKTFYIVPQTRGTKL
jgi:hypothetical protein